jgi:hypothetical protein
MSQHRLPGRISFLMALALAIGSTCAPTQSVFRATRFDGPLVSYLSW